MATIDLEKMLEKIKATQWALDDFNWEKPGAEKITPEQWPRLKSFMADIMWIEHMGARGFACMAQKAETETLRDIYTYFHAEEQRHANAEMALMKRWGMLEDGKVPEPNINIRMGIEWMDRYGDGLDLNLQGTLIPMLEVALDGALCKFLLDTVEDPLCHEVFARINDDEARHLGVGFSVMEMRGTSPIQQQLVQFIGSSLRPSLLLGLLMHLPLLNKVRNNIIEMGLPEKKLYDAMARFEKIGGRTEDGRKNIWFHVFKAQARWFNDSSNHFYHVPANLLLSITEKIPTRIMPEVPSWVKELTPKATD